MQKSYLVYECRTYSFKKNTSSKLTTWRTTGTENLSTNSDLKAISDGTLLLPTLENYGRMSVIILCKIKCYIQIIIMS